MRNDSADPVGVAEIPLPSAESVALIAAQVFDGEDLDGAVETAMQLLDAARLRLSFEALYQASGDDQSSADLKEVLETVIPQGYEETPTKLYRKFLAEVWIPLVLNADRAPDLATWKSRAAANAASSKTRTVAASRGDIQQEARKLFKAIRKDGLPRVAVKIQRMLFATWKSGKGRHAKAVVLPEWE